MGGVNLVAEFAGEGEEAGEGLLWIVVGLFIQAFGKEVLCHLVHCAIIGRFTIFMLKRSISSQVETRFLKVCDRGFR